MMDFEMQGEYDTGFSPHYSFIAATNFRLKTVRLVEDFVRIFETSQLHSQP